MKKIQSLIQNPVAKNSAIMFIGTMAVNFGAYLYQVVVLRIMGPAQYSELAALFSILFIISVPGKVSQTVLTKLFSEKKAEGDLPGAKALLAVMFRFLTLVSIGGFILYLFLIPVLKSSLKIEDSMSLFGLYGMFTAFFFITGAVSALNGFQKFLPSTLYMTLSMILRLGSGVIFAASGVALTVISNAVSNILSFFLFLIPLQFLFRQPKVSFHLPLKKTLMYAFPAFMLLLGVTMFYNVDVVLVKMFFSPETAGIYGGLTVFGKIIFFAASAVLLAVFPMVAEKKALKQSYQQLVLAGLAGILVMSGCLVAAYFILAPFVTHLLFGPKFDGVVPYLGMFGIFMMCVTVINYIGTICLAVNKSGVWKIIFSGALLQIAALILFHETLFQVIVVNSTVTGIIAASSLLYYFHEKKRT